VDDVLPRITDRALGNRQMDALRARVTAPVTGEVLEIGFGSGRNVPHYGPGVTRVRAVDPARVGRKLAAERIRARGVPVEYVGLDGQDLPLPDACVDHVVTTWTLCSIPDVAQALREIRRVLRPGGGFHFVEHGRAPEPAIARWQTRLNPLQRRLFGGCHLDRDIEALVRSSGLELTRIERYYMKGPKPLSYMYEGVASLPSTVVLP
jgi:ubiquinone/menaquinone biosynthesis C-methylase UbiE